MSHPYKEILVAIANGEQIQFQSSVGGWIDERARVVLAEISVEEYEPSKYRVKPKTILINGREVPEPVRVTPEQDQQYWIAHLPSDDLTVGQTWDNTGSELRWLERGILHLTKTAAVAHAEALLSFTSGEGK